MAFKKLPAPYAGFNDLTGHRFGKLVVTGFAGTRRDGKQRVVEWACRCDCGNTKTTSAKLLVRGNTQSCGCLRVKPPSCVTHGLSHTPEYKSWKAMIERCTDPKCSAWSYYGGRGIKVCERWLSAEAFVADMGHRPQGTTIDRIDNDANYSCGRCDECLRNNWNANCRWATKIEQARNTRTCRMVTFDGLTMNISAWAEKTGVSANLLYSRLNDGWSAERALATPSGASRRPRIG